MIEWKCKICGEPADYKLGLACYCDEHWNFGHPQDPEVFET